MADLLTQPVTRPLTLPLSQPVAGAWRSGGLDAVDRVLAAYPSAARFVIRDFNPTRKLNGLDRLHTLYGGSQVPVSSASDPIALVIEEGQGGTIGPELHTDPRFDDPSSWVSGDASITVSGGAAHFNSTPSGRTIRDINLLPVSQDRLYRGAGTIINRAAGTVGFRVRGGVFTNFGNVDGSYIGFAVGGSSHTVANTAWWAGGVTTLDLTDVSLKEVACNPLGQPTSGMRGLLQQVGTRWVWRGDGVDDNLLATLNPSASFTAIVACTFNAGNNCVLGASEAGANLMLLQTNPSGLVYGAIGSGTVAFANGDSRGIPSVVALRCDGTTASVFRKPFAGAIEKAQAAQSGVPTNTVPVRLGARNNSGTVNGPLDGDIYAALVIQAALADDEISAIADQFSI